MIDPARLAKAMTETFPDLKALERTTMTDFNEPWSINPIDGIVDSKNHYVASKKGDEYDIAPMDKNVMERIVACVNALQGIENPQEFVNAAKVAAMYYAEIHEFVESAAKENHQ